MHEGVHRRVRAEHPAKHRAEQTEVPLVREVVVAELDHDFGAAHGRASANDLLGLPRDAADARDATRVRVTIRPVVDRIFPFASTKEALAYVETGRAKGKVVVKVM